MPTLPTLTILAVLAPLTLLGIGQGAAEGIADVDAVTFKSVDLNGDGKISRREHLHFSDIAFLSMDANGDEALTHEEFMIWDTGYVHVAQEAGKLAAFNQAKGRIFRSCDLNQDGTVRADEFSVCFLYDFYKADLDKDGTLNRAEFTREFRIIKTLRSSLE